MEVVEAAAVALVVELLEVRNGMKAYGSVVMEEAHQMYQALEMIDV